MTKCYVAGPMRGYQDFNFPAFNKKTEELRNKGWEVVNPVEVNPDPTTPYAECMKNDIAALIECSTIYMLTGWEKSQGATLEHDIAVSLGFERFYQDNND